MRETRNCKEPQVLGADNPLRFCLRNKTTIYGLPCYKPACLLQGSLISSLPDPGTPSAHTYLFLGYEGLDSWAARKWGGGLNVNKSCQRFLRTVPPEQGFFSFPHLQIRHSHVNQEYEIGMPMKHALMVNHNFILKQLLQDPEC